MKRNTALIWVILATVFVSVVSCSRSANENRSNQSGQNVANEATPSPTPTPTPENQAEEVTKLIGDLASALSRNDADALDNIYSDGYVFVNDTGQVTRKPERIVMIKSGD